MDFRCRDFIHLAQQKNELIGLDGRRGTLETLARVQKHPPPSVFSALPCLFLFSSIVAFSARSWWQDVVKIELSVRLKRHSLSLFLAASSLLPATLSSLRVTAGCSTEKPTSTLNLRNPASARFCVSGSWFCEWPAVGPSWYTSEDDTSLEAS